MTSSPEGALAATPAAAQRPAQLPYVVQGKTWGRARLTITYDDQTTQTIHYYVTKPSQQVVADMGRFLTTKAWYTDEIDPFKRAPSVMTYDRANNRIVTQDTRVWVAGLSDEGGVGAWLAAMMKACGQPKKEEVGKLQQFVDQVVWGRLQVQRRRRASTASGRASSSTTRRCCRTIRTNRATGRRGRLEQRRGRRRQSRLRLSARRRGVLVDVSAGAKPSGPRDAEGRRRDRGRGTSTRRSTP